jgi:hypothetical protein
MLGDPVDVDSMRHQQFRELSDMALQMAKVHQLMLHFADVLVPIESRIFGVQIEFFDNSVDVAINILKVTQQTFFVDVHVWQSIVIQVRIIWSDASPVFVRIDVLPQVKIGVEHSVGRDAVVCARVFATLPEVIRAAVNALAQHFQSTFVLGLEGGAYIHRVEVTA